MQKIMVIEWLVYLCYILDHLISESEFEYKYNITKYCIWMIFGQTEVAILSITFIHYLHTQKPSIINQTMIYRPTMSKALNVYNILLVHESQICFYIIMTYKLN